MPVYRYSCNCGYRGDIFLKVDKGSLIVTCANCRKGTSAHQVRDKTVEFKEKDGVTGILRQP